MRELINKLIEHRDGVSRKDQQWKNFLLDKIKSSENELQRSCWRRLLVNTLEEMETNRPKYNKLISLLIKSL